MAILQYIYTSSLPTELPTQTAFDVSKVSVKVCRSLGITGRVFANRQKALAITEGPEEIVRKYFEAVCQDALGQTVLLHVQRLIPVREFQDYSIWLNLGQAFQFDDYVRELTPETLREAWPASLSVKVRIMADAYLDPEMLEAA